MSQRPNEYYIKAVGKLGSRFALWRVSHTGENKRIASIDCHDALVAHAIVHEMNEGLREYIARMQISALLTEDNPEARIESHREIVTLTPEVPDPTPKLMVEYEWVRDAFEQVMSQRTLLIGDEIRLTIDLVNKAVAEKYGDP